MTLRIFLLSFSILIAVASGFAHQLPSTADEKFKIESMDQKLEFFLNKDKELNARLHVDILVWSTSSVSKTFKRAVFIDNNSEISKIKIKHDRFNRKRDPIISDYESDGIFHSDLKMCFFEYTFENKEKPLEISYTKTFTDIKFLDPLYFNDLNTVENSTIQIEIPDWLDLEIVEWNFDKETPTKTEEKKKKNQIYTYKLKDVAQYNEFHNQPRRNKLNAHLICLPKSYTSKGKKKKLIQDTGDLYAWYNSLVNSVDNDKAILESKVEELTAGISDDLEKIKAIYYWVQDNVRYIAFEYGLMGFQPEACQDVYNNKYGDCKGMANLTKQMLTIAGYDARLTWIGTNDLPYNYDLPSLIVDNHMICTVFLNDTPIFLDATEKYSDIGIYAHRIQGKQVLIENGEEYIIDQIPVTDFKLNKEETVHALKIVDNSKFEGEGELTFSGTRISWLKYILSNIPEKDWDKALRKYIGNADKNTTLKILGEPNIKTRDSDLVLSYAMSIENKITNIGSELYINPEMDYQFKNLTMEEDRNISYEFSNKYYIKNTTSIQVPQEWKATYIPEDVTIENANFGFNLTYTMDGDKITYSKIIEIKNDLLSPDQFEDWNNAIKKVNGFYEDQIILSK